jgi:probable F420-dependent oxidoreductase
MRLGFALPQVGALCDPGLIATAARRGEALGYTSAWVNDRVLWPTAPEAPYPASADGALPTAWQRNMDPLDVLTFAAAHSSTLRLGTSVLVLPLYNPVLLARRLTTIDVLSEGRLTAGFGLGWSPDEYRVARVAMAGQADRYEDALDVLDEIWGGGPVEHDSAFVTLPESVFDLRPVQRPRPPVVLAAYTPAGLARIARRADGWIPVGIPIPAVAGMRQGISQMATDAGRDPDAIGCVVRANVHLVDGLAGEDDRPDFCGTVRQVMDDIERCADAGVDEVLVDVQWSPDVTGAGPYLDHLERFAALIPHTAAA